MGSNYETSYKSSYSWLPFAKDMADTLAEFPHLMVESAELDRKIRDNSIMKESMYNNFNDTAIRIAEDPELSARLAGALGVDGNDPKAVKEAFMKFYRAPLESEDSGKYGATLHEGWTRMSEVLANDPTAMDEIVAISRMTGGTGGEMASSASEALKQQKNSREITAAYQAMNDSQDYDQLAKLQEQFPNANLIGSSKGQELKKTKDFKMASDFYGQVEKDLKTIGTPSSKYNINEIRDAFMQDPNHSAEQWALVEDIHKKSAAYDMYLSSLANAQSEFDANMIAKQASANKANAEAYAKVQAAKKQANMTKNARGVIDTGLQGIKERNDQVTNLRNIIKENSPTKNQSAEQKEKVKMATTQIAELMKLPVSNGVVGISATGNPLYGEAVSKEAMTGIVTEEAPAVKFSQVWSKRNVKDNPFEKLGGLIGMKPNDSALLNHLDNIGFMKDSKFSGAPGEIRVVAKDGSKTYIINLNEEGNVREVSSRSGIQTPQGSRKEMGSNFLK